MTAPVAVIGGSGRVGRLVASLLLDQGTPVRVISRHARRATQLGRRGAELYDADVRTPGALDEALSEVGALVYSVEPGLDDSGPNRPETTMYQGVLSALRSAAGARYFVMVSQIYVTRPEHSINRWGGVLDWRLRGEDAIRASGMPYTIIRPGWLTDQPAGQGLRLEQGDRGEGSTTRADVAAACVAAMSDPGANGKTFEIYNAPGPARPWSELFAALAPDPAPAAC